LDLPVSRVDFVDMVRQYYSIQNQVYDGIINIVSHDLNLQLKIPENTHKTTLDVFSVASKFSRVIENSETSIPNLNPTLYWNPNVLADGNKSRISIKAGENTGRYQVLLQGITATGEILELSKFIVIE